jgi:putative ABC transport system ATP-binding protein
MFTLENLQKVYINSTGNSDVIYGLDLHIAAGETIAVMGDLHSGRTALLRIISFTERPDGGKIFFNYLDITEYTLLQLVEFRRRFAGFLSADSYLINELTVLENINLVLKNQQKTKDEQGLLIEQTVERLKINHLLNKFPSQLSILQQRIVQLACIVVYQPKILIIDDFEGLFGEYNFEMLNLMDHFNCLGMTTIIGTNSETYAHNNQRIIRLFDGYVVEDEIIMEVSVV